MLLKTFILFTIVTWVSAFREQNNGEFGGNYGSNGKLGWNGAGGDIAYRRSYPRYNFEYLVNDPQTGDQKRQQERRHGDLVNGGYKIAEADGTTRLVDYSADDRNGFNAVVRRVGYAHHPPSYRHYGGGYGKGYGNGYGNDGQGALSYANHVQYHYRH